MTTAYRNPAAALLVVAGFGPGLPGSRRHLLRRALPGFFVFREAGIMTGRTERLRNQLGDEMEGLLARCSAGDGAAWERILEAVRQLAMDLGRQNYRLGLEDAEDIAQLAQ